MSRNIATPTRTRDILKKYNLRLSRGLGQNFLVDGNIINIILEAGDIKKGDNIIEIGPGIGALTEGLLQEINKGLLFVIEKDTRMVKVLKDLFQKNHTQKRLMILNQDVLDIKWKDFFDQYKLNSKSVKVIANLPYYITTSIIMGLLESKMDFENIVFMVQKEVAERMTADPGGKDYGSLSIAVQFYARVEIIHQVSAEVFIPRPDVDSSIVKLTPYKKARIEVDKQEFFFSVVKAAFQQRRKNIKNALTKAVDIDLSKDVVLKSLRELKIDRNIRGEKLSAEQFALLSNKLLKYIEDGE